MKLPKLADKYLCTGCLACVDVCPSSAITDTKGYDGHIYVHVDINKLKCERTCINIHDGSYSDNVKTSLSYAVVNKNKTFYENATSGGVFPAIASSFISDGGCVYGAAYIDGIHVKHIRISKISDIVLLQGSKYIQSNLRGIYRQITDDLKDGRKVLFTGTGCQVAGVLAYFKNNKNSELLYTMDLVCGGVPSSLLVETFAKHTKDFSSVISFRQKGQYVFSYKNRNGNEIVCKKALPLDGFKSCLTNRYSCYKCPFAKNERVGDITLADYWGVKRFHSEINCRQGVSLVLINTDKGFEMFNRLQGRFELIESKLEWAASENPNLSHPTPRPKGRGEAFKKAFTNPEVYIKQNSDEQHFRKAVKFTLKRFVKSTPWLYKILVKLK